jgi:hypothetical protein
MMRSWEVRRLRRTEQPESRNTTPETGFIGHWFNLFVKYREVTLPFSTCQIARQRRGRRNGERAKNCYNIRTFTILREGAWLN